MILKVRTNYDPEVWCFFEGFNQVSKQIHYVNDKDVVAVRIDVYDYTHQEENINSKNQSIDEGFLEIWIYGKTPEDTKQILCYRPAYLLNDEGKTIERF
jgi:hypothetical protein